MFRIGVEVMTFIGNKDSFKQRSLWYKKLAEVEKKRVCRVHFRSMWKAGYAKCYEGFKNNEECIELITSSEGKATSDAF